MIKLVNSEFKKAGKYKIIFSCLLFTIVIALIKEYGTSNFIDTSFNLIAFVELLIVIIFSGFISQEIDNGTFRYYLTKPIKRWKIYTSKFICMCLFSIIIILFIILTYTIFMNKFDFHYMIKYLKYSIPLLLVCSLTLLISTVNRSTSFNVGIGSCIVVFSNLLSQILFGIKLNFIEYTFLPYLDYIIFNDMQSIIEMNNFLGINLNIKSGIIIDLIFTIVFYIIGLIIFNYKEIKN